MTYINYINRSLMSCYHALEHPRTAVKAVVVLLFSHVMLLGYSAYVHSPTLNEPGHLVAGLSHWKFHRFDLYNVNPPLVRMVATIPVLLAGYEEDWSGYLEGPGVRPEFGIGEDFVTANGERIFLLFMIARWACIPFSLIGAISCYLWARDLYGPPSGVIACALWCMSPSILAHASLITPDAHAASLGIAACYTYWRWLKHPTWTQALFTGVILGLAELAKTTLVLFYPLWPLLWLLYRWPDRRRMHIFCWFKEGGMLALRMAIGLYVLNLGYGFEDSLKQIRDFHFVSELFAGEDAVYVQQLETQNKGECSRNNEAAPYAIGSRPTNRFNDSWLGALPIPLPAQFLIGIDVQQGEFENFGRPSYLRGQWRDHGWWYYYLYAVTIKTPLALLAIGVITLLAGTRIPLLLVGRVRTPSPRFASNPLTPTFRDTSVLLIPPLFIFVVVSSKTGFTEHLRYVLPCFPFVFIWLSSVARSVNQMDCRFSDDLHKPCILSIAAPSLSALFIWSATSSLWIYPHSLSYFNEAVGGPMNGPRHLLHSNIDWGQDLRYLKWWIEDHFAQLKGRSLYLAYFGFIQPGDVGFDNLSSWPSRLTDLQPTHSICAVSVNLLSGYPWPARGSAAVNKEELGVALVKIGETTVFENAGYSIRLYFRRPALGVD